MSNHKRQTGMQSGFSVYRLLHFICVENKLCKV